MKQNNPDLWIKLLKPKSSHTHKYDYGYGLIISGADMTGASILSAHAALRSGLGLLSIAGDPSLHTIYKSSVHEALVVDNSAIPKLLKESKISHVLMGQGGDKGEAARAQTVSVLQIMKEKNGVCVLDASCLTSFKDCSDDLFRALYQNCILTPHEGEFESLFGKIEEGNRQASVQEAAQKSGCTIILKGSKTLIATQGEATIENTEASPWLATGGTGDVLGGTVLGLAGLTQGQMPLHMVAAFAVWLHSAASREIGAGLIASDIAKAYPRLMQKLFTTIS